MVSTLYRPGTGLYRKDRAMNEAQGNERNDAMRVERRERIRRATDRIGRGTVIDPAHQCAICGGDERDGQHGHPRFRDVDGRFYRA